MNGKGLWVDEAGEVLDPQPVTCDECGLTDRHNMSCKQHPDNSGNDQVATEETARQAIAEARRALQHSAA